MRSIARVLPYDLSEVAVCRKHNGRYLMDMIYLERWDLRELCFLSLSLVYHSSIKLFKSQSWGLFYNFVLLYKHRHTHTHTHTHMHAHTHKHRVTIRCAFTSYAY